jgi:hypothetical protein
MLKQISPQYMREKRAKEKIEDARKRCDEVINKNRKQIDVIILYHNFMRHHSFHFH